MPDVAVHLRYARVAPRKARAVIDVVRGKEVPWAQAQLQLLGKRAAGPVSKLIKAGVAAAAAKKFATEKLWIKKAVVQEGPRLKRSVPHFRGVVRPIDKQMSHITLVLSDERMENGKLKMEKKKVGRRLNGQ